MEVQNGNYTRARPLLEKARVKIQNNVELWISAIKLELDAGNKKGANYIISRALQDCGDNGELWALAVELEPKATRKSKIFEAIKKCPDDPYVNLSVAKIFWKENKHEKA